MEAVSKLLNVIYSNEPEAASYNPPAPVPCEFCGKPRYTRGIVLKSRVMWTPMPETCTCAAAQKAKQEKAEEQEKQEIAKIEAERAEKARERIHRIGRHVRHRRTL